MRLPIVFAGLSLALLMLLAGVATHMTDIAFWIAPQVEHVGSATDSRKTTEIPGEYLLGKSAPVRLDSIEQARNAYIHLKFRFRIEDGDRSLRVFQTASADQGLHVEIASTKVTILVPTSIKSVGKQKRLQMAVQPGSEQWHWVEVEALNGAFVRGALDGHILINDVDSGISMATNDVVVGDGPNLDRSGPAARIDHISVAKGNYALPEVGLFTAYGMLAFLFISFCLAVWKSADGHGTVQRIIAKLSLLIVPLVVALIYVEYRLSTLNTVYYAKRVALEAAIDDIEVLILGSSNTVFGIKPEALSQKAYNLSFLGNGMSFDALLLHKYAERMNSLRVVVLTVNYFTMGMDYATFSQSWRQYFLRQNFGIPLAPPGLSPYYFTQWTEPRNFSRIALYGNRASAYAGSQHHELVDMMTNPSGWFDSGDVPGDEKTKELGRAAAEAHNASVDVSNYDRNLAYWSDLADFLKHRGVKLVIVQLPTDVSYWSNLDKTNVKVMRQKLTDFASAHGIRFADYGMDPRFGLDDFTPVMPDHMNARGAERFSKILDDEVLASLQR